MESVWAFLESGAGVVLAVAGLAVALVNLAAWLKCRGRTDVYKYCPACGGRGDTKRNTCPKCGYRLRILK